MGSYDPIFVRPGIRVSRAAAALPASTAAPLFTVTNGAILMTSIFGVVTTAIQNQANNTKLVANPTTGTDTDLCAVLNIANDGVGVVYTITGTVGDAMLGAGWAEKNMVAAQIILPGTIDLSCSATNTGAVRWVMHYLPLESGAYVSAA